MRAALGFLVLLAAILLVPTEAFAKVERARFANSNGYLIVEVLSDGVIHFEASTGQVPAQDHPLYTSPMVAKIDYDGPTGATFNRRDTIIETAAVRLRVDPGNLCVTAWDRAKGDAYLTTFCPVDLGNLANPKGLNIDPGGITQVYGLGQQFKKPGSADGDWLALGVREGATIADAPLGNHLDGFEGGADGNVQIPVYYALGSQGLNYAVLMDNVYWQRWDFTTNWWQARMFGDQLRWYLFAGRNLPELRAAFMELTGRPPVPPRKAFGLWVSEFGYKNFDQIDTLKSGLRRDGFPVDGFVLDLDWFGGIEGGQNHRTYMGRLNWDEDQHQDDLDRNEYSFPNPGTKIREYAADHIGLCVIEESYLAKGTDTFAQLPSTLSAYQRTNGVCDPAHRDRFRDDIAGFWGEGRMIDWSDPAAGSWIHDNRRYPNLAKLGITCHWTDLGEPESFRGDACYKGVEPVTRNSTTEIKNHHSDIHNLYDLLWNRSIWDGYVAHKGTANDLGITNPRPFILSRSAGAGIQRYGVAMWSGDIPSRLEALATHGNAQMHMSFSGIDYYGADVGGFRREAMPDNDENGRYRGFEEEIFTQWLANAAWFDVPIRPHTDDQFKPVHDYQTAPNLVGKVDSNLANLRQRYELVPYYYSLAHLANETGAPLIPPPVFYYQSDQNLRGMGNEKMIGRDLLVGMVAGYGEYARNVYLPAGRWADYLTHEWVHSSGQIVADIPEYRDSIFRLPVFARAGAILPKMPVDAGTEDSFGHRKPGAPTRDELIVRVYADPMPSDFALYEDDGLTVRYDDTGRPSYNQRITRIAQSISGAATAIVRIDPAIDSDAGGPYNGAPAGRPNVIELAVEEAKATGVSLNGIPLTQWGDRAAFDAAPSGWVNADHGFVLAKSDRLPVATAKEFTFNLTPEAGPSSVYFVCENAATHQGQSVFVAGSIPELGGWNPTKALKLEPNVYYQYIADGHRGTPTWTRVVRLPNNSEFEWKCLRLADDVSGPADWQPGPNNSFKTEDHPGYVGAARGHF
jgi:alpha-glucosidase